MERDGEDGGSEVDKPVGEGRTQANKEEVVPQVGSVLLYDISKSLKALRCTLLNDSTTDQVAKEVRSGGTTSRKLLRFRSDSIAQVLLI